MDQLDAVDAEPLVGRPAASRSRGFGTTLRTIMAGVLGFISGVVFWHAVGFWGLVNEAVFRQRYDGVTVAASPAPVPRTAWVKAQSRHLGPAGPLPKLTETCSEVAATADARVRLSACGVAAVKFLASRGIDRADFADFGTTPVPKIINSADKSAAPVAAAPAVSGWAAQIDTNAAKPGR